jgi:hypothetical protein
MEGKVPGSMVMPPVPASSVYYNELAADFIEQQVGAGRWRENLAVMVREKRLTPAVERWLQTMCINAKPELILKAISELLAHQTRSAWQQR